MTIATTHPATGEVPKTFDPLSQAEIQDKIQLGAETDVGPLANAESVKTLDRDVQATIDAGAVFINAMVATDLRMPLGCVKSSGHGRERCVHGIREFTNIKTVWVE